MDNAVQVRRTLYPGYQRGGSQVIRSTVEMNLEMRAVLFILFVALHTQPGRDEWDTQTMRMHLFKRHTVHQ